MSKAQHCEPVRSAAAACCVFVTLAPVRSATAGRPAAAHGAPSLSASQTSINPGGKVTLSGDGLGEDGDVIMIELRGPNYAQGLGQVKLTKDAFDDQAFAVPANAPAGPYKVVAMKTAGGAMTDLASAELTLMNAGMAEAPSQGLPAPTRSPAEWVAAALLALIPTAAGLFALFQKEVRPAARA